MPLYTVLNQFQEGSSHIAAVVRRRKRKGGSLTHFGGGGGREGVGGRVAAGAAAVPAVAAGSGAGTASVQIDVPAFKGGTEVPPSRAALSRPTSFTAPSTLPPGSIPLEYDSGIVFTSQGPKTRRAREKLAALGVGPDGRPLAHRGDQGQGLGQGSGFGQLQGHGRSQPSSPRVQFVPGAHQPVSQTRSGVVGEVGEGLEERLGHGQGQGQGSASLLSLGYEPSLRGGIVGSRTGEAQAGEGAGSGVQQGGLFELHGSGMSQAQGTDLGAKTQAQAQTGHGQVHPEFEVGQEEYTRRRSMDETRGESQFSFHTSNFTGPGAKAPGIEVVEVEGEVSEWREGERGGRGGGVGAPQTAPSDLVPQALNNEAGAFGQAKSHGAEPPPSIQAHAPHHETGFVAPPVWRLEGGQWVSEEEEEVIGIITMEDVIEELLQVLYCTVPYSTVLFCNLLYCSVLHCT